MSTFKYPPTPSPPPPPLHLTQNSKFLQFVSRMSRGEIVVEDGIVKEIGATSAEGREGEGWAEEFEALHHTMRLQEGDVAGSDWANEFAAAVSHLGQQM